VNSDVVKYLSLYSTEELFESGESVQHKINDFEMEWPVRHTTSKPIVIAQSYTFRT
jgi:hypothetical protein